MQTTRESELLKLFSTIRTAITTCNGDIFLEADAALDRVEEITLKEFYAETSAYKKEGE